MLNIRSTVWNNFREADSSDRMGKYHGTAAFGVAYAPGVVGQAFDIQGGGVRVNDAPALSPPRFTLSAWIFPRSPGYLSPVSRSYYEPGSILWKGSGQTQEISYGLRFTSDGKMKFVLTDGSAVDALLSSVLRSGAPAHVAATYDGATVKLYINGIPDIQKATAIRTPLVTGFPLTIGPGVENSVYSFDGWIDEPALFSRALDESEVRSLYSAGAKGMCAAQADTTPPVVAPVLTGAQGANGWYTSDVQVSWMVTLSPRPSPGPGRASSTRSGRSRTRSPGAATVRLAANCGRS